MGIPGTHYLFPALPVLRNAEFGIRIAEGESKGKESVFRKEDSGKRKQESGSRSQGSEKTGCRSPVAG
jgi:hypothetical protein